MTEQTEPLGRGGSDKSAKARRTLSTRSRSRYSSARRSSMLTLCNALISSLSSHARTPRPCCCCSVGAAGGAAEGSAQSGQQHDSTSSACDAVSRACVDCAETTGAVEAAATAALAPLFFLPFLFFFFFFPPDATPPPVRAAISSRRFFCSVRASLASRLRRATHCSSSAMALIRLGRLAVPPGRLAARSDRMPSAGICDGERPCGGRDEARSESESGRDAMSSPGCEPAWRVAPEGRADGREWCSCNEGRAGGGGGGGAWAGDLPLRLGCLGGGAGTRSSPAALPPRLASTALSTPAYAADAGLKSSCCC